MPLPPTPLTPRPITLGNTPTAPAQRPLKPIKPVGPGYSPVTIYGGGYGPGVAVNPSDTFGAAGLAGTMLGVGNLGAGGVGKRFGHPFGPDGFDRYADIYNSWGGWGGGGGGCPRSGAPVKLYGDPLWWTKRTMPCTRFIKFITSTGRTGEFSYSDERYTNRGLLKGTEWKVGDKFITEDGEEEILSLVDVHDPDGKVDFYAATQGHIYSAYGVIGHNKDTPDDPFV